MIKLFSQQELDLAKSNNTLALQCEVCCKSFLRPAKDIRNSINNNSDTHKFRFCSRECTYTGQIKSIKLNCPQCQKEIVKLLSQTKRSKQNFCSQSCSMTWRNAHKITGTRKSKLEIWLEIALPALYPALEVLFTRKNIISSELDIYIPNLKLAFELNGIVHYKPIYGDKKLFDIKNNDKKKLLACSAQNIELIIIDTSKLNHFSEKKGVEYLNKIVIAIDQRLSNKE